MEWGLIADDLTGGLDSGVAFVACGETHLRLPGAPEPERRPVTLVLDTESRGLPPGEAAARAAAAAVRLQDLGAARVYKKIDSTLRGPWAQELEAARATLGVTTVLIAPAFPAMGRGTRGGRIYVGGAPLEATPLGTTSRIRDHLAPLGQRVSHLHVTDVRAGDSALARRLTAEQAAGAAYVVADAEREEDLRLLASAAAASGLDRLSCGSGGLAEAWARVGVRNAECGVQIFRPPDPHSALRTPQFEGSLPTPILVIAASRHPVTQQQVTRLVAEGRPTCFWWSPATAERQGTRAIAEVRIALETGRLCLLATEAAPGPAMPEVVRRLGEALAEGLAGARLGTLLLTGGETAFSVLAAGGAAGVRLEGLCRPGIPRGVVEGGLWDGVTVVTKAGGFGDEEALLAVIAGGE